MSAIIDALERHARLTPERIAIEDGRRTLSYRELADAVEQAAQRLRAAVPRGRSLALLADNSIDWAIADLAALSAGMPIIPLPTFFSASQIRHALRAAGVGYVLAQDAHGCRDVLDAAVDDATLPGNLVGLRLPNDGAPPSLPAGTWKVTFTSGTTGAPKGVCLGTREIETTAQCLLDASLGSAADRHLCLLPLATLLENIGGLYAPILAGATTCVPPLAELGFSGSSSLDAARFVAALQGWQPTSVITVPQLLQVLVKAAQAGLPLPRSLRHVAVGGAPVALRTLHEAWGLGLPVYEGYGLSECASVVALNRPDAHRQGSVGKPLPHVRVSFAADGEILVAGGGARGFLGEAPLLSDAPVATGDLGYLDAAGFLHLTGRKKNVFVTSYGRNVAPEWVERELVARAPILQAAVFGEARPFNTAVIVAAGSAPQPAIESALSEANRQLPDYARVHAWIAADAAFSFANGLATANGRLRRDAILARYADRIEALYQQREKTGTR